MATVVVKIGTSSITDDAGVIDAAAVQKLCDEVARVRADGDRAVVVTSGAIAAGMPALGMRRTASSDMQTLQAASAVGQGRLLRVYDDAFAKHDIVTGQVLITPFDFMIRQQYLHARDTLARMLALGVMPIVNENDALADDEIRFGDNDRIAALVAHLVSADVLVLLTDAPGLFTADPRLDEHATLIEEIVEIDAELEAAAGGSGSDRGSGGMASKLAAAKIAAWSGVRAVIAGADRPGVLHDAVAGVPGVGTVVRAREKRLPARQLWIAFAVGAAGTITVDDGARRALIERNVSLLPAGVVGCDRRFSAGDAVEILGPDGRPFAKGIVKMDSATLAAALGRRTAELPEGTPHEVVHRDDLVVLP
jgi:glutamate 5-kinase